MAECGERAVLIVTRAIVGTSTTIVDQRLVLSCMLPQGHAGAHQDTRQNEAWDAPAGKISTLLRHEDSAREG
jgi:hypothetical protein